MHGVSHPFVTRAFEILNFPSFTPVAEQKDPDPEFPTVRYPNPEEKGALVSVVLSCLREFCPSPMILQSFPSCY